MMFDFHNRKVAIYGRVSSEMQKRGQTIDGQLDVLEKAAKENGASRIIVYKDEAQTGGILNRPGLQQMLADAKENKFECVLMWDTSRASRDVENAWRIRRELEDADVMLYFYTSPHIDDSPTGNFQYNILAANDQYAREVLSVSVRRGKLAKVEVHKQFAGHDPGYGYIYDPKVKKAGITIKDGKIRIDPVKAKIVKKLFEMSIDGYSGRQMVRWLHDKKIKSPTGNDWWAPGVVNTLLSNELYSGVYWYGKFRNKLRHNQKAKKIKVDREQWIKLELPHLRIVSRKNFLLSKKAMKRRYKKPGKTKHFYLLRGIGRCGYCKASLHGSQSGNKTSYYRCGGRSRIDGQSSKCPMRMIKQEILDDIVLKAVEGVVADPQGAKEYAIGKEEARINNTVTEREITKVEKKLCRLLDAYTDGAITLVEYKGKKKKLEQEMDALKKDIVRFESHPENIDIEDWTKIVKDSMESLTKQQQRQLLDVVMDNLELKNGNVRIRLAIPGVNRQVNRGGGVDASAAGPYGRVDACDGSI